MVKPESYQAVAASQTGLALGPARRGVLLQRLIITVATAATGTVAIADGNGSDIPITAVNTPIGVYTVELGIRSNAATTPGWKITTGGGATVVGIGKFGGE
jgi:hypothetical protein